MDNQTQQTGSQPATAAADAPIPFKPEPAAELPAEPAPVVMPPPRLPQLGERVQLVSPWGLIPATIVRIQSPTIVDLDFDNPRSGNAQLITESPFDASAKKHDSWHWEV